MDRLKKIAVFANPNGQNELSIDFLATFKTSDQADFQVVSLAEQLAEYTKFPSPKRKTRLEEILSNAATETARSLTKKISEFGLSCGEPEVVNGRFPAELETWLKSHQPDLLVKQSLPCDGEFGHASKGDLRLSRHVAMPILLLNSQFTRNGSVMVGVPPIFHDNSGLSRAVKIIKHSVFWARKLGSTLHLVHAWQLFGESYLSTHSPREELDSSLANAQVNAKNEIATAVEECQIPEDVEYNIHVHKGEPTRVLIAELELLKPNMVVMGSVANEGVKGVLLGNTAETITRRRLTNTLIIK